MTLQEMVAKLQSGTISRIKFAMPDGMRVTLISRPLTLVEWREAGKQAAAMLQALKAENLTLREALATYDCGKKCSYLKGKYLINGRCPRDYEGSCGKVAHAALSGAPKQEQSTNG